MGRESRASGIRLIHQGEEYAVLELTPSLIESEPVSREHFSECLSAAEAEVLALLLRGSSNAEIAAARSTSVRTVANQLQQIYRKGAVTSRVELIAKLSSPEPRHPPRRVSSSRRSRARR